MGLPSGASPLLLALNSQECKTVGPSGRGALLAGLRSALPALSRPHALCPSPPVTFKALLMLQYFLEDTVTGL